MLPMIRYSVRTGIEHVVGTVEVDGHPDEMETDIPPPPGEEVIPLPETKPRMYTHILKKEGVKQPF